MDLGGARLKYATAQPLCRIGNTFVFFAMDGIDEAYCFRRENTEGIRRRNHIESVGDRQIVWRPGVKREQDLKSRFCFRLTARNDANVDILTLTQEQARHCHKARIWGEDRIFISNAGLTFDGDTVRMQNRDASALSFAVYPAPAIPLTLKGETEGIFTRFSAPVLPRKIAVEFKRIKPAGPRSR